jgi:hypothetical protein
MGPDLGYACLALRATVCLSPPCRVAGSAVSSTTAGANLEAVALVSAEDLGSAAAGVGFPAQPTEDDLDAAINRLTIDR